MQYQVIQNGKIIGDFTGSNSKQVTVDAPNLLSGKIYTYNFVLAVNTSDIITFTMSMNQWGEGNTKDVQVGNPFFCELTLLDGTTVNIEDIDMDGRLTINDISSYEETIQSAEIGELCTGIYEAFKNCRSLTSVTIPESVTYINFSLQTPHSLEKVIVPNIGKIL